MSTILFFFIIAIIFVICMFIGCTYHDGWPFMGVGIIITVIGVAFLAIAETNCTFVAVKEEYPIYEATLSVSGKYGNPVYVVTYQEQNGELEIGKTEHIFKKEEPGPDVFALCEYKFLFLKMEKYAYFTNFENVTSKASTKVTVID